MTLSESCLQLDVGNSSAKWRLCQGGEVIARGTYVSGDSNTESLLLGCSGRLEHIWISSVTTQHGEEGLAALLRSQWGVEPWFARTESRSGSLVNSYEDPARMGVDRWLAMLGARQRESGRLCVVDAGSALTIDLVDVTGQHEGGYIIPGPALMERSLLLDTGRVRFSDEVGYQLSAGTSTARAVRHGIALAQAGAVALALDQAGDQAIKLLFCGGGGEALMQLVGRGGQWLPDLVFEGLEIMAAGR